MLITSSKFRSVCDAVFVDIQTGEKKVLWIKTFDNWFGTGGSKKGTDAILHGCLEENQWKGEIFFEETVQELYRSYRKFEQFHVR
jgi:hypothetical protein